MLNAWRSAVRRAAGRPLSAPAAPERKEATAFVTIEALRSPEWSGRDYAAFAREGLMQNPVVYRAVRMIAESAAAVPLLVYAGGEEQDAGPLTTLLQRPNALQSRAEFV